MITTTPTPSPTVDALNAARETAVSQGNNAYGGANANLSTFTAASTGAPVMTPSSLQNPVAPITVTQPQATTGMTGVQGAVDSFTSSLASNVSDAQTTSDQSLDAFIKALQGPGEAAATDSANKTAGVDTAKASLDEVNQQILSEKQALNNRVDAIRKNSEGMSEGAVDQEIQRATDDSTMRMANLSVTQAARNGLYTSAKDIADRAVAAFTESRQNNINALQTIYEDNKSKLTTAEQQQFEVAQTKRAQELAVDTHKQEAAFDQTIKQNDPLYQAQLQKAEQDAASAVQTGAPVSTTKTDGSDIVSTIAAIARGAKLSATTQTNISNILGVINSAQSLAQNSPDGVFKGISPLNAVLDAKIPFTDIGIPGRQALRSPEGINNQGFIEGINLKVQQWASGASLTNAQTEQVMKMVPSASDTDTNVKTKLNNIVNFMQQQIKGALAPEGVVYDPTSVNLFGGKSLDEIFAP